MQQWFNIIQGTAAVSALSVAIVNLINSRASGIAPPFSRECLHTITESTPARQNGTVSERKGAVVHPVRRYLCLSIDVQGYGRNDDIRQAEIQRDLIDLLDRAGERAGLDRCRWIRQPKGDEELALIPADEPLGRVVGDFCLELAAALWRYNRVRDRTARMRLRLALDDGPVDLSLNGFVGRAVVGVSRLVNARPLRRALDRTDQAELAVILSDGVYRDWVHSGRSSVRPEWYHRTTVVEKEYVADAWLWLPTAPTPGERGRLSALAAEPEYRQSGTPACPLLEVRLGGPVSMRPPTKTPTAISRCRQAYCCSLRRS